MDRAPEGDGATKPKCSRPGLEHGACAHQLHKAWPITDATPASSVFGTASRAPTSANGAKRINERWTRPRGASASAWHRCRLAAAAARRVSGVTGRSGEASRRLMRGSSSTARGGGSSVATLLEVVGSESKSWRFQSSRCAAPGRALKSGSQHCVDDSASLRVGFRQACAFGERLFCFASSAAPLCV